MSQEQLSIQDLKAWYTRDAIVLKDLGLRLLSHERVGLIGVNGAGKTTLIRVLAGLLETFEAKSITWEGKEIPSFRDPAFKKQRFLVFTEDSSFGFFTFREYLSFVMQSYGRDVPEVEELIEGFHFQEYTDVLLKDLSTGNRKKASLICAFALHPPLLLLDEPVNGLDFQSTEYLYHCIKEYRSHGTLLFSSHILESITLTCDRVLVLEEGRISRSFTGEAISAESIREVLKT